MRCARVSLRSHAACWTISTIDSCFDIMDAYARPLPMIAIALMLGVETTDCHDFKQWSDGKMQMFNPRRTPEQEAILAASDAALTGYFTEVIQKRRRERRADLISSLIDAEEDGEQLDEAEIIDICKALLIAGNVTTTDLIGNGALALLRHPSELSKLLAEPNLIRSTVEEVLRYDSPVMQGGRIATEAMQIGGCRVAAGQTINAMLYAANHDSDVHILIQSGLTSNGRTSVTTHLAGALISVLARHWPGPRLRSLFRCSSSGSRGCA